MDLNCDRCGKHIPHGHPYICLTHNIEQMSYNMVFRQEEVNVISSDVILILCGKCGNSFNAKAIKQILKAIPTDEWRAWMN